MTETNEPVPGATHSVPDARGYKWKSIGARISEARTEAGFTQRQLSELLGVSSQTVWCWEAGRMKPTSRTTRGTGVPMPGDHGLAPGSRRGGGGGSKGDRSVLQGRRRWPSFRRPAVDPGVHPICEGEAEEEEEGPKPEHEPGRGERLWNFGENWSCKARSMSRR